MAHGNMQLDRSKRACECRVDITGNKDEIRLELDEGALEPLEGARRLLPVQTGADLKLDVRSRKRELCEEDVVERLVVVLTSMDQPLLDKPILTERPVDGRDLHIVRARADDVRNQEAVG